MIPRPGPVFLRWLTSLTVLMAADGFAATLLSQNFSTDPTNYTLPGASSPFRYYSGPRYWAISDMPGLTVNAGVTGGDGPYLAAQNLDGGGFTFSAAAPPQIDFAVPAAGYADLKLAIALAGMPAAETENFIRARTDNDGDGTYETPVFDFKGSSNSAYTDAALGALTAAFRTFTGIALAKPTAGDGLLRLRLEVYNDTDSANEAAGIDSILVSGTPAQLSTAIVRPASGARVPPDLTIAATADDNGSVTGVAFFADGVLLGNDTNRPYSWPWTNASPGAHVLRTVAWDNDGNSVTSDAVNVTVSLWPIRHAMVVSVDGMGSEYVKPLLTAGLPTELTTFRRFQAEGAGTLNARNDPDYAVTLPNHITMVTGRGVSGPAGHNWTSNGDPLPTDTIASNKGAYVASAFDVAHDNGLRTGIWSGKSKFGLFRQSYGPASGAADATGFDNGPNKIDYEKVVAGIDAQTLTDDIIVQMQSNPFDFAFIHYQDPDAAGHASGWSTNPASAYAAALKSVDTQVGRLLQAVANNPEWQGCTAVILTADHGGHGTTHGDTSNPLDYTIPFYVWGAAATAGADIYALNRATRPQPGPSANPPYTGGQPVRNGDAANLALCLLGLGPVPGSMVGTAQDLQSALAPVITGLTCSADGLWFVAGRTDAAGLLVAEQMQSLDSNASPWETTRTNPVLAGAFNLALPPRTNVQSFLRLLRR